MLFRSNYLQTLGAPISPSEVTLEHLQAFIRCIGDMEMAPTSQARILSGIKSFFKYCLLEQICTVNPTTLLPSPKTRRKLPDVLSFEEIEQLISYIDVSKPEGGRNRAILETMYSSGLRVTELIELKISCLYLDLGYIRVIGKGNKERLIPVGGDAIKYIKIYKDAIRVHQTVAKNYEDRKSTRLNSSHSSVSRMPSSA